ncbi:MAG: hypothetical protein JOZ69_06440 [Myxococcales bacterium]|nr:hypothetical protein [Myxococcales bacterium]
MAPSNHSGARIGAFDTPAASSAAARGSSRLTTPGTVRHIATGAEGADAVDLAERAASMASAANANAGGGGGSGSGSGSGNATGLPRSPFESPAREKLVVVKAPLLPRE